MKPLKLALSAFGPFAGSHEIDFRDLGETPLFLINGVTGAGKSSILDAMCFALYGQTTGKDRVATEMRSDRATDQMLTEVTLDFVLGEKNFRVRRIPQQQRAKKSGGGTTNQAAEAYLYSLNASLDESLLAGKKVSEVDAQIKHIIGLEAEQFRQVMVLPQGKFVKLLQADSREREAVFSTLFQTHIYKRIEEALAEQSKALRERRKELTTSIAAMLGAGDAASEAALTEEITTLTELELEQNKIKDKTDVEHAASLKRLEAGIALNAEFANLEQLRGQLTALLKQQDAIDCSSAALAAAHAAQGIFHSYNAAQRESSALIKLEKELSAMEHALTETAKALESAASEERSASESAQAIESITEQKTRLTGYQAVVAQLAKADKQLVDARQAENKKKHVAQQLAAQAEKLAKEKAEQQAALTQLDVQLRALADAGEQQQKLGQILQDRKALQTLRKDLATAEKALVQLKTKLDAATASHTTTLQDCQRLELAWHTGHAARLARRLNEGEPCPVCGSVEHPQPAEAEQGLLITEEQLDAEKAKVSDADAQRIAALNRYSSAEGALASHSQRLKEQEVALGDVAAQSIDAIEQQLGAATARVEQRSTAQQQRDNANQRITDIDNELDQQAETKAEAEQQWLRAKEDIAKAESQLSTLQTQVPEDARDASALASQIATLATTIKSLGEAQRIAKAALQAAEKAQGVAVDAHKRQLSTIAEQRVQGETAADQWHQRLSASPFATESEFLEAAMDEAEVAAASQAVKVYQQQLSELKGAINTRQSKLQDKTPLDIALLEIESNSATDLAKAAHAAWDSTDRRLGQIKALKQKIDKERQAQAEVDAEYEVYGTLSDAANGLGEARLSFHRFVLRVLLDDVLIQASERLSEMTNNRYRLLRNEERGRGGGASGLDLLVEDAETGKNRSVTTLSGGESFMAALALALGVSDVVQSYAGGIHLQALFIDEGFGSLDPESLERALRVLVELQSGGRMIGIISHVPEVKEQMPLRIDVTKSAAGSALRVIGI